jgi:hypothetical protein
MSEIVAPSSCSDRVIRAGRSGKSPRAAASSVSSRRLGFHGCPRYRSGMEAVSKSGVAKRRLDDRVGPGGARTRGHPCPGGDRATLHAAVISCCVLPSAKARTCSPRVGEGRLPPAGFAGVVRPRCRAGAAAFVAVVAVLAETAFFACRPLLAGGAPEPCRRRHCPAQASWPHRTARRKLYATQSAKTEQRAAVSHPSRGIDQEARRRAGRPPGDAQAGDPGCSGFLFSADEPHGLPTTPSTPRRSAEPGFAIFGRRSHGHWLGWPLHGRRRNRLRRFLDRRTLRFIADRRVTYRLRLARLSSHWRTPY